MSLLLQSRRSTPSESGQRVQGPDLEWFEEARAYLESGSGELDPALRQQVAGYLTHGFRHRHRQATAALDRLIPRLDPAAATRLAGEFDYLTTRWLTLHRLVRRGDNADESRLVTAQLLHQLRYWLSQCELAGRQVEPPVGDWNAGSRGQPVLAGAAKGGD